MNGEDGNRGRLGGMGSGRLAGALALAAPGLGMGALSDATRGLGAAATHAAEAIRTVNVTSTLGFAPKNVGFTTNQGAYGTGNGGRVTAGALKHTGWTNRRYQRAARKARNVKANRRAHRG